MNTCKYRPLGQRVVLRINPIENKSSLVLPDGKTNPNERQTFEVVAVGGEVNDAKFSLAVGETVLVACHQSDYLPLSEPEQLVLVDRSKIVAAIEKDAQNQN